MANKILLRRDSAANWTSVNPTLAAGEFGVEIGTPMKFKMGDGTTAWNSLAYITGEILDLSTSDLDDLADGTTYKRIAAAVATALNAGTYDAASVSAFGIGDVKSLAEGYNIDTLFANGRYSVTRPTITGGGDFSGIGTYTIDVMKSSDGACIQLICRNGSVEFKFRRYDTISWYTGSIWTAFNDGNGGQPPAPKPRSAAGAGNLKLAEWDGANTKVPDGGQWIVFNYDHAAQQWNTPAFFSGGTSLTSSNIPAKYLCWRIAE